MIRSMTGYGRARKVIEGTDITVEIKSVNNRYCELNVRMPRAYMQLEESVRALLKEQIIRGKVDVGIMVIETEGDPGRLVLNEKILEQYLEAFKYAEEKYGLRNDIAVSSLTRLPDVLTSVQEDPDMNLLSQKIMPVVSEALSAFIAQREKEGEYLVDDIIAKCSEIASIKDKIAAKAEALIPEYIEKLKMRTAQLMGDVAVDEQRMLTEIAIMADRMAIDEELVRLGAHIEKLKDIFEAGLKSGANAAPSGKMTDFIIQEMNRETNTVTSKIGDLEITNDAIAIKALIEKIREQIQNIE